MESSQTEIIDQAMSLSDPLVNENIQNEIAQSQSLYCLFRVLQDSNRILLNQSDTEYHPEFKPIVNIEHIGYILEELAKYVEINSKPLRMPENEQKIGRYLTALAKLQNVSIGLITGRE